MKTMMMSDYLNIRSSLVQLSVISVFIAVFMAIATGTVAVVAGALAAMIPFMMMFSLAALDEKDGWEQFRLTLPITRKQVVVGRYVLIGLIAVIGLVFAFAISYMIMFVLTMLPADSIFGRVTPESPAVIAGSALGALTIVMLATDVVLPLMMRFGMTKATRIVPMVLVLGISAAAVLIGDNLDTTFLQSFTQWFDEGNRYLIIVAGIIVVDVLLYIISALVSIKLYERRVL